MSFFIDENDRKILHENENKLEVLIKNNEAHLIRKRDVFEDLLKNQVELL